MRSYSHVLNNVDAESDILITLYLNCLAKISLILSQFSSSFLKNFQLMVNELASQLLIMLGQFFSYNLLFSKDLDNPVLSRSVSLTMHPVKTVKNSYDETVLNTHSGLEMSICRLESKISHNSRTVISAYFDNEVTSGSVLLLLGYIRYISMFNSFGYSPF